MKISYATPGGSYTTLGDESDRSALVELFAPTFQPTNQETPLAGGTNTFKAPRGNLQTGLQIVITIPYSTRAAALASVKTVLDAFNAAKKHIKVEQDATVHYYPNALLNGFNPVLTGTTVRHQLTFITDTLTTSAP